MNTCESEVRPDVVQCLSLVKIGTDSRVSSRDHEDRLPHVPRAIRGPVSLLIGSWRRGSGESEAVFLGDTGETTRACFLRESGHVLLKWTGPKWLSCVTC